MHDALALKRCIPGYHVGDPMSGAHGAAGLGIAGLHVKPLQ